MMKKGIYAILAAFTIFAMVMTGCPDGGGGGSSKTKVTLNPATHEMKVGDYKQIIATTDPEKDSDGELLSDSLTWTSSDVTVATVSSSGFVRAYKEGNTTITATAKDGGNDTCAITVTKAITSESDVKVVGDTLEHYTAKLVGVTDFGNDLGTTNDDGSYTFDGTSADWSGGGAQYTFPKEKSSDTWKLSNYALVEIEFKITGGSVDVKSSKYGQSGESADLMPYPSGSPNFNLSNTVNGGVYTFKTVIEDAGDGIGFQRKSGGPATVAIIKVIFSKLPVRTITFNTGGANLPIASITVYDGRKAILPYRPKWEGHTFLGWFDGTTQINEETLITKDYNLIAKWNDTPYIPPVIKLTLDKTSWDTLPNVPSNWLVGSITYPTNYAATDYDSTTHKLTITFDGSNRQRAIIPLSKDQIYELQDPDLSGVTFRIVGTVTRGEQGTLTNEQIAAGELGFAGFRLHLIDPILKDGWAATQTGLQTPLTGNTNASDDHLVEYRAFNTDRSVSKLAYFAIQAMFRDNNNADGTKATGFPKVIIEVESITIDRNDTSSTP
jgi:hypothetical protein